MLYTEIILASSFQCLVREITQTVMVQLDMCGDRDAE